MGRAKRSGFTLIEVLIVVGIIGLLVAILAGALLMAVGRGEEGKAKNFVTKVVPSGIEKWQDKNGKSSNTYPPSPKLSDGDGYWQGNAELYEALAGGKDSFVDKESYVVGKEGGRDVFLDPWNNFYIYRNYSAKKSKSGKTKPFRGTRYNENTYDIISMGPDGQLYTEDDIHNGLAE